MTATEAGAAPTTKYRIVGKGYEFCNCQPGCTCNFSGFPTSPDGSCKALVGNVITSGSCGDVDLSGIKAVAIIDWPKAIHDGNGRAVFVVEPSTTDAQIDALARIYTGQLGGLPWSILGTTYSVAGLVKAPIEIVDNGRHSSVRIPGIGEATGTTLKNPVTGEDNIVDIALQHGFIWKLGQCGVGSFHAAAEGLDLSFKDSNWILYDFDWSNAA
ncbi:MAG: DUF1326 domain-containing protein [Chloroflexi bacterium]|nr:MAG: DUF1326 domain-containing protein [Chloroflexota bacterium]